MDWARAIEVNSQALIAIVAAIFRMLRIEADDEPERLPRLFHRRVLRLLIPAESAARRVIVMAARGMTMKPAPVRPSRPLLKNLLASKPAASEAARPAAVVRPPAFQLYDKRLYLPELVQHPRRRRRKLPDHLLPRIWVLGDDPPFRPPPPPEPEDDGMVNAQPICRRLHALQAALADVPQQALRLMKWQARRERDRAKRPLYTLPLRPGVPPGYKRKPVSEVDHVLIECHWLALNAMRCDTS
jgi:hypothetical protein